MSKPPYIDTQGLRLWNRPAGEFFGGGPEQDTASESLRRRERWRADGSEDSQDDPAWLAITREHLVKGAVSLPEEDWRSLRRVVVVVDSGRGKTTLLRRLAMEFGKHLDFNVRLMVPVRLSVNDLMPTTDQHWATDEEILQRIGDSLRTSNRALVQELGSGEASNRKLIGWLRQMREKNRLVVLVDALDQSAGPQIETIRRMLSGEMPEWDSCRFILTGRPPAVSDFNELTGLFENPDHGWQIVRLEPFTIAEQQRFVGSERWHKIPDEARLLLDTPRVCEYVQNLTDEDCEQLKTVSDVYYGSLRRMIAAGLMAKVAKKFGPGQKAKSLPPSRSSSSSRPASSGRLRLEADPVQIDAALCLLSAIAFELICLPNPDTKNLRNKVETTEYESFIDRVHDRVRDHPRCVWKNDRKFRDDVERLRAVNATELDFWFFDNSFEQTKELWFRDATIKEFLAAYWCSKHGTKDDPRELNTWVYLPDRPRHRHDTNPQYRWFWRYLCEMPPAGRTAESWLRCIEILWRPGSVGQVSNQPSDSNGSIRRSCEMMYLSWQALDEYRKQPNPEAVRIVETFLNEFLAILNTDILHRAKIAAQLVPEHMLKKLVSPERFKQIRPPANEPAFVRCPPWEVEEAEQKKCGNVIPPEGLPCYTFHMGADARLRDGYPDIRVYESQFPRHRIRLHEPFDFQATTVSRKQFRLFDPSHDDVWKNQVAKYARTLDCPVVDVSWFQSWCFALWCGMSLPTEVEWEFAVRAGRDDQIDFFPTGETISSFQANFASNKGPFLEETVPVRSRRPPARKDLIRRVGLDALQQIDYQPNRWGVFHPIGNVAVWCLDWFSHDVYARRVQEVNEKKPEKQETDERVIVLIDDPPRPTSGTRRSYRGGDWRRGQSFCCVAYRAGGDPGDPIAITGIRLLRACCEQTS